MLMLAAANTAIAMPSREAQTLALDAAKGDIRALASLSKAAERGDTVAQNWLGVYNHGTNDYAQARSWWEKAAAKGSVNAEDNLALLYERGEGVPQDYASAVKWYRTAARQGDPVAEGNLGWLYATGQGVPQDYAMAVSWTRMAAVQGNAGAQLNLGNAYYNGQGVAQDYIKAVKWTSLAADQGDAQAQYNLGGLYANGQGVPQNYVEAYKWFILSKADASPAGDTYRKADKFMRAMVGLMTPEDISLAQKEASSWFASHMHEHAGRLSAPVGVVPTESLPKPAPNSGAAGAGAARSNLPDNSQTSSVIE